MLLSFFFCFSTVYMFTCISCLINSYSFFLFGFYVQVSCQGPAALYFLSCDGLRINGIRTINSPKNHISITSCNNADISNVRLQAPGNSPNTDGINISKSNYINIHDSNIGTGDDCVAINGTSSFINITRVACGPGHGISVGSLRARGIYDTVHNVYVYNCIFTRTQNGARIKTWPGGSGYATNITIERITINNAQNPIIIDQHYCNGQPKCPGPPSGVQVTNVIYHGFNGTSTDRVAVMLDCSEKVPCSNLQFDRINLAGAGLQAVCNNAKGRMDFPCTPSIGCLRS